MKICSRCASEKPADTEHFSPLKKAKDGLHSWCKSCLAEWRREDRAKKKDHYKALEARRMQKHGEKRRAANRLLWEKRGSVYRENAKARLEERRAAYNENRRVRYASNPDLRAHRAEANRRWHVENAEAHSERRRLKWQNATPTQRLRTYFGAAISHVLAGRGKGGRSWQQLVGYTAADLKAHLERQFLRGMTWENYGDWHVDHIVPIASFEITGADDPALRICWGLPNLRPMWAADNIRKSDNRTHLI